MENSSPSTKSIKSTNYKLDNLPNDIYLHLFEYCDLDDIWTFRLINKAFYSIVKSYDISELSFIDYSRYNATNYLFSTTRSIKTENQLDVSKRFILKNPSNNLLNLKYLRVTKSVDRYIMVEDLNQFSKLEILEIKDIRSHSLLQLPNLKALSIVTRLTGSLKVDCPNLQSLLFYKEGHLDRINDRIKFNYPESIKYFLIINSYDCNSTIFTNLECLELYSCIDLTVDDILKLNSIKKLRLSNCSIDNEKLKDLFKSKRNDLELILDGVKINDIIKLYEFNRKNSALEFQLNNFSELEENLHFVSWRLTYNNLEDLLPDNQSYDIISKFISIQGINIDSRIKNENRLAYFIGRCCNLFKLIIKRSSLSQQFYDQLPTIKSLSYLEITEEELDLNFEFIIKMTYLKAFKTDQNCSLNSHLNLNMFKRLINFEFRINDKDFMVFKDGRDIYSIRGCEFLGYFNHDKLIEFINYSKNFSQS